jgi:mRNA interferase HicA
VRWCAAHPPLDEFALTKACRIAAPAALRNGGWRPVLVAHIFAHVLETNRTKVVARLQREGWQLRHGGKHDIYQHPQWPDRAIVVPRHRTLSLGVARAIAKAAGWTA